MLIIALVFFACAALLGVYLLSYVLINKETPKGAAIMHGFFAVMGVTILVIFSLIYSPYPLVSLVLFIIAALGGLVLIYRDLSGKTLPKWMAIGHGSVAVVALVILAIFVFHKYFSNSY